MSITEITPLEREFFPAQKVAVADIGVYVCLLPKEREEAPSIYMG